MVVWPTSRRMRDARHARRMNSKDCASMQGLCHVAYIPQYVVVHTGIIIAWNVMNGNDSHLHFACWPRYCIAVACTPQYVVCIPLSQQYNHVAILPCSMLHSYQYESYRIQLHAISVPGLQVGGGPHEGSPINVASHLYTTGEEFYNFYTSIRFIILE